MRRGRGVALNDVRFFVYPARAEPHEPVVGIAVDGVDLRILTSDATRSRWLRELADEDFESDAELGRFVLGLHDGLPAADTAWPARHFLGEPAGATYGGYEPGELAVLGCGCGIWGCWPLLARIDVVGGTVVWSGMRQPFRAEWGELPMGPYVFGRESYLRRLGSISVLSADPLGTTA